MYRIAVLVGLGVLLGPAPASAQFVGGIGANRYGLYQQYTPYGVGNWQPPVYGYQFRRSYSYGVVVPGATGPISLQYSGGYQFGSIGINSLPPRVWGYTGLTPRYTSAGYMTGGAGNPAIDNAQKNFEAAQRQATAMRNRGTPAKTQIFDQWAYEKLGVVGLTGLDKTADQPEALRKALAAEDEEEVASGEVLNHIMVATVALEAKGARGPSAFLPPQLLNEVRFAGSMTAGVLNTIRTADRLDAPAAFDTDALRGHAATLGREFAGLVGPVLAGKSVDSGKLAKFEAVLKLATEAAAPQVKALPFEDAIAVRKYLNKMDAVVKVLKDQNAVGFVNGKWGTEGANVADLVKHMTKYKLLFGPADTGGEEAYLALHRGLSAYLVALSQKK